MITEGIDKVTCPKCGSTEHVVKFNRDIYIVRENNDFVRRKLYGCNGCENIFTYDSSPRKEHKNMNIQNIFSNIAKQCENVASGASIKM